ncbi:MAG TPA: hypothetical protein VLT56_00450, partial [Desulfobacterales bacterium]|nr:hypothetical protein [Desulfobacterales bacterium]
MQDSVRSNPEKKDRIFKNWLLQDVDEVPFLIEIGRFHAATSTYFSDHAAELRWNVDFHKQREGVYDYGMPNIKPNQGINIIASACGCAHTVSDEADPWVTPLIRDDNVQDVYTLKVPDPKTNPVFRQAWERIDYLQ